MLMTFISGFGFGMFQAVDTALMSQVLPSAKSFAKDLGVVNIAATLPQTLAPAVAGAIVLSSATSGLFPVAIVLEHPRCVRGLAHQGSLAEPAPGAPRPGHHDPTSR